MPDLKAAAKRLRGGDWTTPSQDKADRLLAAQALEAWAWMAEKELCVERFDETWRCFDVLDANYWKYKADTPLGAVLAAMEGEKNGK